MSVVLYINQWSSYKEVNICFFQQLFQWLDSICSILVTVLTIRWRHYVEHKGQIFVPLINAVTPNIISQVNSSARYYVVDNMLLCRYYVVDIMLKQYQCWSNIIERITNTRIKERLSWTTCWLRANKESPLLFFCNINKSTKLFFPLQ